MAVVPFTFVVVAACFALLTATFRIEIAKEYEREVFFRLGRPIH
jgi:hypothetical protein